MKNSKVTAVKTSFKVGDTVRVVRRVTKQKGWENDWASEMDNEIGRTSTINKISTKYGIGLVDSYFSFPSDSLELVQEAPGIKYQYIREGDLCISISTTVSKLDNGDLSVVFSTACKHPKDKFSKAIAREVLATKQKYRLILPKRREINEIRTKILSYMFLDDIGLTSDYKRFIRRELIDNLYGLKLHKYD